MTSLQPGTRKRNWQASRKHIFFLLEGERERAERERESAAQQANIDE